MTPPQADDFIGREIGHYKIIDYLGGGGMGVVYTAEDTNLKRVVALKFLPAELTQNAEVKERFKQEARTASALDHPNICTIHQIGETDDGQMFICMSFYQGHTLSELIRSSKPDMLETVTLCMQVARGLTKAHDNGIIHRDIKPANIIVTKDDLAKILDFGLAKLTGTTKLTKTGTTMGTPAYMSPEQVRGKEVGPQSDIFSLGVIMYEMLTSKLPFEGENEMSMMYAIVNEEPPGVKNLNPDVPPDIANIVEKAMAKDFEDRYASMSDMLSALTEKRLDLMRNAATKAVPTIDDVTKTIMTPSIPEEKPGKKKSKVAATPREAGPQEETTKPKKKKRIGVFITFFLVLALGAGAYFNQEKIKPLLDDFLKTDAEGSAKKEIKPPLSSGTAAKPGAVYVKSNPAGATIIFDGSETGLQTPATLANIAAGRHEISVALTGYNAYNANIDVISDSTISWNVPDLAPLPGQLSVRSDPAGAAVIIDGSDTGRRTPATFDRFDPGTHHIQLKLQGFKTFTGNAMLAPGRTTEISEVLSKTPVVNEPMKKAGLAVNSRPEGAVIFLNGKTTQRTTPHTFADLTPGQHQVKLVLDGFKDRMQEVGLTAGNSSTVNLDLKLLPPGRVRITSVEIRNGVEQMVVANVFLDGKQNGQTPRTTELQSGKHTVTVKLLGYPSKKQNVEIKPGKLEIIKFIFSK